MLRDAELNTLLRKSIRKDSAAFQQLYQKMHPLLLSFLYRATGKVEDAEDLFNEAMLVVWRNGTSFRGESQVTSWIFGVASRMAKHWWQRQHKQQAPDIIEALSRELATSHENTIDLWIEQQTVNQSLAKLTTEQRTTVELAYFFGYSCEEIARLMACPTSTVKTRLFYARQKLREIFIPFMAH